MKSKSRRILALAIAVVAILGTTVTALAATGAVTFTKVDDKYVVDYIISESTVDGVLVQNIERKWIPENRFNKDDPRNPIPSTPTPGPTDKIQKLRQAGTTSYEDLKTYATGYQWDASIVETSASDSEVKNEATFQVDEVASVDCWVCTFTQVVKFDNSGKTYVKYYIGSQEYSVAAIKRMFAKYGKAK